MTNYAVSVKENAIQSTITHWFKEVGIVYHKLDNPKGAPDLIAVWKDKHQYFEVKSKNGALSAHQKAFHQRLRKYHQKVYIVRSLDEVRHIVKYELKWSVEDD